MAKARASRQGVKRSPKMGIGPRQKTFKSTGSKASSRPVARSNKGKAQLGEPIGVKTTLMKDICTSDVG